MLELHRLFNPMVFTRILSIPKQTMAMGTIGDSIRSKTPQFNRRNFSFWCAFHVEKLHRTSPIPGRFHKPVAQRIQGRRKPEPNNRCLPLSGWQPSHPEASKARLPNRRARRRGALSWACIGVLLCRSSRRLDRRARHRRYPMPSCWHNRANPSWLPGWCCPRATGDLKRTTAIS